jgi:ATP-dependent protease ClpP protease subunit
MSNRLRRDDVDRFFEHDIHPLKRFLYLGGEIIDDGAAERFLKGMMLLEEQNHEAISVLINSGGGDCYHGLAIYDAIATAKSHVTGVVFGQAMSMAGWILQAADDRVLAPASTLMLHSLSWEGVERTQFMKRWSEEAQRLEG